MSTSNDRDAVLGVLLHGAGLDKQPKSVRLRIGESISPVSSSDRVWQACDEIAGAFWIVGIGYREIELLGRRIYGEPDWRPHPRRFVIAVDDTPVVCASFHDRPSLIHPPVVVRMGGVYVYRNPSGYSIPVPAHLAESIFARNDIKL